MLYVFRQTIFQLPTKLFSSLFVKRNCTSICSFFSRLLLFNFQGTYALRFRIACLLYHKLLLLSSTFFKFFQLFSFTRLFFALFLRLSFSATFVLYHKVSRLSRGFCNFLRFFQPLIAPFESLAFGDLCSIPLLSPLVNSFFSFFRSSMFCTKLFTLSSKLNVYILQYCNFHFFMLQYICKLI